MAFQNYIQLNEKRYAVYSNSFKPGVDRQRTLNTGLTGRTIINDFTVSGRVPQTWQLTLKVYINDPPSSDYGTWADLYTAYGQDYVTFIEHDDTQSHNVTVDGPLFKMPHVPANISGQNNGVLDVNVTLEKVFL